jgi:hypothetical protein
VNSHLKDNVYDVPMDVIQKINHTLTSLGDKNVHGIKRAKNILNSKKVTYGQLKKIIHELGKIDKVNDKLRYDLYGGELMEKWASPFLNGERSLVRNKQTASKNINNNTGLDGLRKNAFLSKHSKADSKKASINLLKSNSEETSVSGLFEEINRIKKIINY